jgi:hypothetical protein
MSREPERGMDTANGFGQERLEIIKTKKTKKIFWNEEGGQINEEKQK